MQHIAAWFYVSGSLGVIYCGDYLVLFLFLGNDGFCLNFFLVWLNKDQESLAAGYRYLSWNHTFGGVVLLLGFVLLAIRPQGDLSFDQLDEHNTQLYTWLIMAGLDASIGRRAAPSIPGFPMRTAKPPLPGRYLCVLLTLKQRSIHWRAPLPALACSSCWERHHGLFTV
ncbi:MAG: hypothetical protein U5L74_03980 [Ideonella sp.]|nr:hypothetical protein [Ideonella sp.]